MATPPASAPAALPAGSASDAAAEAAAAAQRQAVVALELDEVCCACLVPCVTPAAQS
jgi:hypothetical protein